MEMDFDLINLTPDMQELWGSVIKKIRNVDSSLYALCSGQIDVEFGREEIILNTRNESTYILLNKSKKKLEDMAGNDVIKINKPKAKSMRNKNIESLKKLFGEKLTVVK